MVEVKEKGSRTKAAKEVLDNPAYSVNQSLKLTAQNIGETPNILAVPYYLSFYALTK